MNFFTSQDAARKKTKLLVFFFLLAVILLIGMTNLLFMVTAGYLEYSTLSLDSIVEQFNWETFFAIGLGVLLLISVASLYKIMQLSGGGSRVAEMMDGELIVDSAGDIHKQRVLNIVEEMAIASGTPVPPVYLIHDDAINAFAAGTTAGNAVIGVTSGIIKKLNREQLQGVIAHEFSHIHNGDMRLNIRLIGLLNGILIIGTIGYFILRSSSRGRRSRSSKNNGGGIIFLGIGLMIIGYAGTFFGNIIKAAVSRQREYLADASAVQFTRNKNGIAGALKRIGGDASGSIMQAPSTAEISHTLFGQGVTTFFSGLFATHPPLEKRIRAIQPNWDGEFEAVPDLDPSLEQESDTPSSSKVNAAKDAIITGAAILAGQAAMDNAIDSVGQPTADNLSYAQKLIATLPDELKHAAHNPYTARAVIYYLVLENDQAVRERQLDHLKEKADSGIHAETIKLIQQVPELHDAYRLPLVEIALSPLKQLSMQQYLMFRDNLDALIKMDNKISVFEWSIQKIIFHHLDSAFNQTDRHAQNKSLKTFKHECAVLLSFLIYAGKQDGISAEKVFEIARGKLEISGIELLDIKKINLKKLDTVLDKLQTIKPLQKPQLLKACAACITADSQITTAEAELFRAISDILDCPMPPLTVNN